MSPGTEERPITPDPATPVPAPAVATPPARVWSPLWELVLARLREFFREPAAIFWTYGFPTVLALALGVAFSGGTDPKAIPIAVLDGPRQAARVEVLQQDPALGVVAVSEEEARRRFQGARIVLAVGGDDEARFLFDPTNPEADATRRRVDDLLQRAAGRKDAVVTRSDLVQAPGSRYIDFLIPGLIGMNVMSSSLWGIGYALVEARKRKLLKRLAATPMKRSHFVGSFLIARMVFLVTEVAAILAFAVPVFDVQFQGSILAAALLAIAGAMAFAGLGLVAASRTTSTETVSGLMNIIMLPMFVLSGVFFSASHFPDWMQMFIRPLPLTLLNDGLRAVINEGAGVGDVALPLLALTGGALLTLTVGLRWFRWT
jgi:ABC-type multidrug transport system permease subunit